MLQKVFKTGNSLALTIPARFVTSCGIRPGDKVNAKINPEKGKIVYQFSGIKQLPLEL